ncbi:MAG: DUF1211 domain-containing protein [Bacteroidetes bacterium]|nr:DUF1211 domain-containing protein [Bacteroidota bacterium]
MKTTRLEAFSDGVFAILITIMVLELKVPEGSDFSALKPLTSKVLSYILSFIYLGIYWNNHHHMFHAIEKVNGKVLWANLALLFMLSLIPFTTAWMGENHFEKNPVALYGINLMLCALTYTILEKAAIRHEGKESAIGVAIKNNRKEYISLATYVLSAMLAFFVPVVSMAGYASVAILWLIPDTRIEKQLRP